MSTAALSPVERIARLPREVRRAALQEIEPDPERIPYYWPLWARPNQRTPVGDWSAWLYLAGRGTGKSRTGAEWVRSIAEAQPKARIALVAPTAADARDVMVEGESGLLAICPPWNYPNFEPSKRRLTWPNGARATLFSADEPARLRGPNHHAAWADELAAWRFLDDAWSNLQFGLRLGENPRVVITTTPRPLALLKEILADEHTAITRGSTYENRANLAPDFFRKIIKKYEGTRLGRQELLAEILEDVEGALWNRQNIDDTRVKAVPDMQRVVVAVDPAVTSGEDADETGIVVAGKGVDGDFYVLDDRTCKLSPDGWARRAVDSFKAYDADRIIAEVNNGGDMVERVIRTVAPRVPYEAVRATRGKVVRAEPIAALYEQKRCHHAGTFGALEDQLCSFTPDGYDGSPDRLDALVWALTFLSEGRSRQLRDL